MKAIFKSRLAQALAITFALSSFTVPLACAENKKYLILDINDVLFKVNRWDFAKQLLSWDLAKYMLSNLCSFTFKNPKTVMFDFLEKEFGAQKPSTIDGQQYYITSDGRNLPAIFCNNKKGLISSKDVIAQSQNLINADDNTITRKFQFSSNSEKAVITSLISAVFDPATIARHTHPIDEAAHLFKKYADQGIQILILSNFPADTFAAFKEQESTKKVFEQLGIKEQHIFISGTIQSAKPEPNIYKELATYLTETEKVPSEELAQHCLFIDDKESNIKSATDQNFTGIVCDGNYTDIDTKIAKHFGIAIPEKSHSGTGNLSALKHRSAGFWIGTVAAGMTCAALYYKYGYNK